MRAGLGYLRTTAARTRAPLLPGVAVVFMLVGVFHDPESAVGDTWGLTGLLAAALCTWLTLALLLAEPAVQADMATVALGGPPARLKLLAGLVALQATVLAVLFVAYPIVLQQFVDHRVFDRPVHAGDVVAALLANATGGLLGGAVGVACGPPQLTRRASSAGAALAGLLVLVVVSRPLGDAGGPLATARALTHAAPGRLTGAELVGAASSVVLAALLLAATRGVTRR